MNQQEIYSRKIIHYNNVHNKNDNDRYKLEKYIYKNMMVGGFYGDAIDDAHLPNAHNLYISNYHGSMTEKFFKVPSNIYLLIPMCDGCVNMASNSVFHINNKLTIDKRYVYNNSNGEDLLFTYCNLEDINNTLKTNKIIYCDNNYYYLLCPNDTTNNISLQSEISFSVNNELRSFRYDISGVYSLQGDFFMTYNKNSDIDVCTFKERLTNGNIITDCIKQFYTNYGEVLLTRPPQLKSDIRDILNFLFMSDTHSTNPLCNKETTDIISNETNKKIFNLIMFLIKKFLKYAFVEYSKINNNYTIYESLTNPHKEFSNFLKNLLEVNLEKEIYCEINKLYPSRDYNRKHVVLSALSEFCTEFETACTADKSLSSQPAINPHWKWDVYDEYKKFIQTTIGSLILFIMVYDITNNVYSTNSSTPDKIANTNYHKDLMSLLYDINKNTPKGKFSIVLSISCRSSDNLGSGEQLTIGKQKSFPKCALVRSLGYISESSTTNRLIDDFNKEINRAGFVIPEDFSKVYLKKNGDLYNLDKSKFIGHLFTVNLSVIKILRHVYDMNSTLFSLTVTTEKVNSLIDFFRYIKDSDSTYHLRSVADCKMLNVMSDYYAHNNPEYTDIYEEAYDNTYVTDNRLVFSELIETKLSQRDNCIISKILDDIENFAYPLSKDIRGTLVSEKIATSEDYRDSLKSRFETAAPYLFFSGIKILFNKYLYYGQISSVTIDDILLIFSSKSLVYGNLLTKNNKILKTISALNNPSTNELYNKFMLLYFNTLMESTDNLVRIFAR
jgi:hypothetical protein